MKKILFFLLMLAASGVALATIQKPDILIYNNLELSLCTGWGHPSPLETYYYQNNIDYPFTAHSTANYRGHVAIWKIYDDKFYLSEIHIRGSNYKPHEFKVRSNSCSSPKNNEVLADWFSGILECDNRSKSNIDDYLSYYFHVRHGVIVEMQILTRQEFERIRDASEKELLSDQLKSKLRMLSLNDNYIAYYFRLNKDDKINYEQQSCFLSTSAEKLSPIFAFYNNSHLNWPYNWENTEISGAPNCQWLIKDNKLYLTGVELYSGLSYYYIETKRMELEILFKEKVTNGIFYADWVSGVYLIKHGHEAEDDINPKYKYFKVTEITYIRIKDGLLIESYSVPGNFNPKNVAGNINQGLKQIIADYK